MKDGSWLVDGWTSEDTGSIVCSLVNLEYKCVSNEATVVDRKEDLNFKEVGDWVYGDIATIVDCDEVWAADEGVSEDIPTMDSDEV